MLTDAVKRLRDVFAFGLLAIVALYLVIGLSLLFKSEVDSGWSFTERAATWGYLFSSPVVVAALVLAVVLTLGFGQASSAARVVVLVAVVLGAACLLLGLVCWLAGFGAAEDYSPVFGGVLGAGKVVGIFLGLAELGLLGLGLLFAIAGLRTLPRRSPRAAAQWGQPQGYAAPPGYGYGPPQGYEQPPAGWGAAEPRGAYPPPAGQQWSGPAPAQTPPPYGHPSGEPYGPSSGEPYGPFSGDPYRPQAGGAPRPASDDPTWTAQPEGHGHGWAQSPPPQPWGPPVDQQHWDQPPPPDPEPWGPPSAGEGLTDEPLATAADGDPQPAPHEAGQPPLPPTPSGAHPADPDERGRTRSD
jgi:hypothetical protein